MGHTEMTMKTISISRLKATLSEQLRAVKQGHRIVVTDRGRPVAVLAPLGDAASQAELEDLVEAGLVSPGSGPVDPGFWQGERPSDPGGSVRRALLEERESGW